MSDPTDFDDWAVPPEPTSALTARIASLESALREAEERAGRAEGELAAALVTIGDDARRYVELDRALTLAAEERDSARSRLAEVERDTGLGSPWLPEVERIAAGGLATVRQSQEMAEALIGRERERELYFEANTEWRTANAKLVSQLKKYRTVVEAGLAFDGAVMNTDAWFTARANLAVALGEYRKALDALPATESPRPEARCHDECGDHGFHCMREGCPGIAAELATLRSQLAAYRTVVEAAWEWQRFAIKKAGTYADAVNATRGLNAALDALPAPSESAKGSTR
jgi:hypothetical protein